MKVAQQATELMQIGRSRGAKKYGAVTRTGLRLKLVPDFTCETAYTDAVIIGFNPWFVIKLTKRGVTALWLHEVFHVVKKHPFRMKDGMDHKTANVAGDYEINNMLDNAGMMHLENVLINHDYDGWSFERIYRNERRTPPPPDQPDQPGEPGEGDGQPEQPGNDNSNDGDSSNDGPTVYGPDDVPDPTEGVDGEFRQAPVTDNNLEIEWDTAITVAIMEEEKREHGDCSGNMLSNLRGRNDIDIQWEDLIDDFCARNATRTEETWSRPNRRMLEEGYFSSIERRGLNHLVVACDSSMSVTDAEAVLMLSSLLDVAEKYQCSVTYIPCDTRVILEGVSFFESDEYPDDASGFVFPGRGGTRFDPVFKYVEDNIDDVDALIYFTDGHCRWPKDVPDYPVLWGITDAPMLKRVEWGESVHVIPS